MPRIPFPAMYNRRKRRQLRRRHVKQQRSWHIKQPWTAAGDAFNNIADWGLEKQRKTLDEYEREYEMSMRAGVDEAKAVDCCSEAKSLPQ